MSPFIFRAGHDYAEDVDNLIETGFISKFFLGVALPAPIIWFGVVTILSQVGNLVGRHGTLKLTGNDAIAWGITIIAIGALLHFRFFWRHSKFLWRFADLGILVSLIALVVGMAYVVISFMTNFYN